MPGSGCQPRAGHAGVLVHECIVLTSKISIQLFHLWMGNVLIFTGWDDTWDEGCFVFPFFWTLFDMCTAEGLESERSLRHPAAAYFGQSESFDFSMNHGIPAYQSILRHIETYLYLYI